MFNQNLLILNILNINYIFIYNFEELKLLDVTKPEYVFLYYFFNINYFNLPNLLMLTYI